MSTRFPSAPAFRLAAAVIGLAFVGQPAFAASDDAWKELWKKSEVACLKASRLNQAKAQSPVDFEAAVLRVVTGRYPQPHMKNAAGTVYCLYDKKSGKAEIAEPSAP
ncbi:MAG: hypothetical protein O9308_15850 [Beijerinckiaceae bacterium]|nr:hypothetical protein [Beijerinckiaceae bacterium]